MLRGAEVLASRVDIRVKWESGWISGTCKSGSKAAAAKETCSAGTKASAAGKSEEKNSGY